MSYTVCKQIPQHSINDTTHLPYFSCRMSLAFLSKVNTTPDYDKKLLSKDNTCFGPMMSTKQENTQKTVHKTINK